MTMAPAKLLGTGEHCKLGEVGNSRRPLRSAMRFE